MAAFKLFRKHHYHITEIMKRHPNSEFVRNLIIRQRVMIIGGMDWDCVGEFA